MCDSNGHCGEVWAAERQAARAAAGRMLAQQLKDQDVDRYATIKWKSSDGQRGKLDLDLIQSLDLATIMEQAGI